MWGERPARGELDSSEEGEEEQEGERGGGRGAWGGVGGVGGGGGRDRIEELYAYGQFVLMYGKNHQYCKVIILQLKFFKK